MIKLTPQVEAGRLNAAELVGGQAVLGVVLQQVDGFTRRLQKPAAEFRVLHVQCHLETLLQKLI